MLNPLQPGLAGSLLVLSCGSIVNAAITVGGDPWQVGPLPQDWNSTTVVVIGMEPGKTGSVELVDEQVTTNTVWMAMQAGSSGHARISGALAQWDNPGLVVGSVGDGSLVIESGAKVYGLPTGSDSPYSAVGFAPGAQGSAVVSGPGALWDLKHMLMVGHGGTGSLTVSNGAQLITGMTLMGRDVGFGEVLLTGTGTVWRSDGDLFIGNDQTGGHGRVTIANGAMLQTTGTSMIGMGSNAELNLHVSGDGMLVPSSHFWVPVNMIADAFLPAGSYRPIIADDQYFMSIVKAQGGTYDKASQLFTVSAAQSATAGPQQALSNGGRLILLDEQGEAVLGLSAGAGGTSTFEARPLQAPVIGLLSSETGETILAGWEFQSLSASDLTLSFKLGAEHVQAGEDALRLWQYDGSEWALLNLSPVINGDAVSFALGALHLGDSGTYAGYALISAVPEPGILGGIVCITLALAARRQRRAVKVG